MANAKYEFTGETKNWLGVTLKRIRLVVDIAALGLTAGTLGGWIESEKNSLMVYFVTDADSTEICSALYSVHLKT